MSPLWLRPWIWVSVHLRPEYFCNILRLFGSLDCNLDKNEVFYIEEKKQREKDKGTGEEKFSPVH